MSSCFIDAAERVLELVDELDAERVHGMVRATIVTMRTSSISSVVSAVGDVMRVPTIAWPRPPARRTPS
jgi:hypothetical protein